MKNQSEIVISGMAGSFPDCFNVVEFQEKLFAGINLVHEGPKNIIRGVQIPSALGKIPIRDYFDTTYFRVPPKLGEVLDPLNRLPLQAAFEAMCDAGINPGDLAGAMTGTFSSSFVSEYESTMYLCFKDSLILGASRAMQANRIAFHNNLRGPSFAIHNNMASLSEVLAYAMGLMRNGDIDSAIIVCVNLVEVSLLSHHWNMMGRLSHDNTTKSFADDAKGYSRSEAVVAFFLQKEEDALRSYGRVLGANIDICGSSGCPIRQVPKGVYPSALSSLYTRLGVDPTKVAFVEGAGIASKLIDAEELNALAEVMLTEGRKEPLLVGCVKTNVGHTEGCADAVGLVKALIAANTGLIPPQINYSTPNSLVPALKDGRIKVVTEPTPLEGDILGVNALCLTGSLRHIVLERHPKGPIDLPTEPGVLPADGLPRLLVMSGRNEESTMECLKKVEKMPIDPNFIALTHRVFSKGIKHHIFRGYTVLNDIGVPKRDVQYFFNGSSTPPPLWFVFTGMGSQWAGMGQSLMRHPTFAKAINHCHEILERKGLDLIHIITTENPEIFENILHSFVGIAAVQIGLVDILFEIGIQPDGMIGHSVGELACAYADGCFTAEQTILAAYARGKASLDAELIQGMMAAVGLGYQKIKDLLPEEIEVACHNSANSCTLSGPAEPMKKFIAELVEQGIFAKLVNVSNIAYHSRYIKPAAPGLLEALKKVIPNPKPRSKKWVSTSVPESQWDSELAKTSSAEYHTNNLLSPVLFEEGSVHVPQDAAIVEISPHGLLQAILKKSFPNAHNIPLTNKFFKDGMVFLLDALGRIYTTGINFDVEKLYAPVEFPVPRGTPNISFLINWEGSSVHCLSVADTYKLAKIKDIKTLRLINLNFDTDLKSAGGLYLKGSRVVPISVFIKLSIDAMIEKYMENLRENEKVEKPSNIEVSDLKQNRFAEIKNGQLTVQAGIGVFFEASDEEGLVISHKIKEVPSAPNVQELQDFQGTRIPGELFYNELEQLDFQYSPSMQLVKEFVECQNRIKATVVWNGDLILFLEAVLLLPQFAHRRSKELNHVQKILQLNIDLKQFSSPDPKEVTVVYDLESKFLYCEGLTIVNPVLKPIFHENKNYSFLQPTFVPHELPDDKDVQNCLENVRDIIVSNIKTHYEAVANLTILELQKDIDVHREIIEVFGSIPGVKVNVKVYLEDTYLRDVEKSQVENENVLTISGSDSLEQCLNYLKFSHTGFLLLKNCNAPPSLEEIFNTRIGDDYYSLWNYVGDRQDIIPNISSSSNDWELRLKNELNRKDNKEVYLVNSSVSSGEITHILQKCKKFQNSSKIRYIFHDQPGNFKLLRYNEQLKKGLRINVLCQGKWGRLELKEKPISSRPLPLTRVPLYRFSQIRLNGSRVNALGLTRKDNKQFEVVEYSLTSNGKDICGVGTLDEEIKTVIPDHILKWEKPKNWSDEEISSVLLSYTLAYYILKVYTLGNFDPSKSKKVLVNQGFLPLSQAVINIGLKEGYEVYSAYVTQDEKKLLKSLFPQIPDDHLISFERMHFSDPLKRHLCKTGFEGFSIVVNNSSDEKMIEPFLSLLSPMGLFFQNTMDNNEGKMGMVHFLKQITVFGVTPDILMSLSDDMKESLRAYLDNGLKAGYVKPISYLGLSQEDSNLDVLELSIDPCFTKKIVVSKNILALKNSPYLRSEPNDTYILIVNDNNDLWHGILEWLVGRNCRQISLIVDWKEQTNYSLHMVNMLIKENPAISITIESPSTLEGSSQLKKYLSSIKSNGTIPLIFIIGEEENSQLRVICEEASDSHILYYSTSFNFFYDSQVKKGTSIVDSGRFLSSEMLLPILDCLSKTPNNTLYFDVNSARNSIDVDNAQVTLREYLPLSPEELLSPSQSTCTTCWKEVRTQAMRLEKCNKEVNPIFVIPPLKNGSYDNLIKNLFYPTFKAVMPKGLSLMETAQHLYKGFLKFDCFGLLLVCSTWSCELGTELAKLVEESGKIVRLVVFDSDFNWQLEEPYIIAKKKISSTLKNTAISPKKENLLQMGFDFLKERIELARTKPTPPKKKLTGMVVLVSNSLFENHLLDRLQSKTESKVNLVASSATSYLEMVNSRETINLVNLLGITAFADQGNEIPLVTNINLLSKDYINTETLPDKKIH